MKIKNIFQSLIDLVFPNVCFVCGELIGKNDKNNICETCLQQIKFIDKCCKKCGYPLSKETFMDTADFCDSCSKYTPKFDIARSVCEYRSVAKKIILGLKFYFLNDGLNFIAEKIYETYKKQCFHADFVCFVPITNKKLFMKGFNHSALIANQFVKLANKNGENLELLYDFLVKTKNGKQSKKMSQAERYVSNHFFAISKKLGNQTLSKLEGKTILLIDDIMTTGSTLNDASLVIKNKIKCKVQCLTFARTMLY